MLNALPHSTHARARPTVHPNTDAHAELVIGNIVRRVMHIIREEMEAEREEQDDDLVAGPAGDAAAAGASSVGGLSRAFRHPFAATSTRTLSLHNLLDQGALEEAAEAAMQQHQQQAAAAASPPAQQGSGGGRRASFEEKERKGRAGQWDRKQEVRFGGSGGLQGRRRPP